MGEDRGNYQNLKRAKAFARARYGLVFLLLGAAFCFITVLNINSGSVTIPLEEIISILFHKVGDETQMAIIWKIRLPRIFMAAILGGALSLAGFLLQTFFANPIAGPFILGISSGAKMVVALTMIYVLQRGGLASSMILILAAFVGAMASVGFILLLSQRLKQSSVLLVGGIMIGYICSAITDFLVTFANDSDVVNLRNWSLGSFSGMDWDDVAVAAVVVFLSSAAVFLLSKPLGAYQLGEAYAQSMGLNVKLFRVLLILLASLLAACVTAYAGPISFVGIAVPYLVKRCLNTAKPLVVIPATFLGGSVFCMFCDLVARTAFAPTELNISTATSLFGAPVVIFMLIKRHERKGR